LIGGGRLGCLNTKDTEGTPGAGGFGSVWPGADF
jgi:hypothetical protein